MFDDEYGALVPFRNQELTTRKKGEIAAVGNGLVGSINEQIHKLARFMINSYDGFELRMSTLQIDALGDRRHIVEQWVAAKQEAEERLYESYLRYRKELLPEGKAIDLLAEAEGVGPSRLRGDYGVFREFVRDNGHRVGAADRVLAEHGERTRLLGRGDLRKRLAEAEERFAAKTFK